MRGNQLCPANRRDRPHVAGVGRELPLGIRSELHLECVTVFSCPRSLVPVRWSEATAVADCSGIRRIIGGRSCLLHSYWEKRIDPASPPHSRNARPSCTMEGQSENGPNPSFLSATRNVRSCPNASWRTPADWTHRSSSAGSWTRGSTCTQCTWISASRAKTAKRFCKRRGTLGRNRLG